MITGANFCDQPRKIGVEEFDHLIDIRAIEPATIVAIVEITGRGGDEDQAREPVGPHVGGKHADHRADRVADEDHVPEVQRLDDLQRFRA